VAKVPQLSAQSRQPNDRDTGKVQLATAVHNFVRLLFGALRFRGCVLDGYTPAVT
jgi:hypothetical protein